MSLILPFEQITKITASGPCGSLAYYSGAKLGAMTRLPEPGGLLWIGIAWAVALPLLYGAAKVLSERFHFLDVGGAIR